MKRMLALALALAIGLSAATAADADILEELRRGDHFDRESLFGTGPDVLARALASENYLIANLARYFENGERGFPANAKVANRLYEAAYRRGHWSSALDLARAAEAAGNVRKAFRYYAIVFLVADEKEEISVRVYKTRRQAPSFTHLAYAGMAFLERSGAILLEEFSTLQREAIEQAMSRGFFGNCPGVATRECVDIGDDDKRAGCQIKAEDRCYVERAR